MSARATFLKIIKSSAFWWFLCACVFALLIWFVGPGISFYDVAPLANVWLQLVLIVLVFLFWGILNFKERFKQHLSGRRIFQDHDEFKPQLGGHINRRQARMLKKD